MKNLSIVKHLSKEEIVKSGSVYTPKFITKIALEKVKKYVDDLSVIIDIGAGYGSFSKTFSDIGFRHIATDSDKTSVKFLKENLKDWETIEENSLLKVSREKYNIKESEKLIIIGNPPYNDTTSQYKKNHKGKFECDEDLRARDCGISFMRAYDKLKADIVCILHPLSYLIKKQNFSSLKEFKEHYKLIDAEIFSSKEFETIRKSQSDFPVVIALYKRNENGMDFQQIENFEFKILNSKKKFCLKNIGTIDGKINKYPKKNSTCKLQFYTQRDMNSLLRNKGFVDGPIYNGIDVNILNLYQYAWLLFLKENFYPKENRFLYGNLSPLYSEKIEEKEIKNLLVNYAFNNSEIVRKHLKKEEIEKIYGEMNKTDFRKLKEVLEEMYL